MKDTTGAVPDHVPDEWTARYADPRPEDMWATRLAEIERSARRDTRWLTLAAAICVLALVLALGWAGWAFRAAVAQGSVTLGVIVVAFAICLWLVHRVRRADRL